MGFKWNKKQKVQKYDVHSKQVFVQEETCADVIRRPQGHRSEDIINAICVAVSEMIDMHESQAATQQRVFETLKKKQDEPAVEVPQKKTKKKRSSKRPNAQ
jgi:hypothetical protein